MRGGVISSHALPSLLQHRWGRWMPQRTQPRKPPQTEAKQTQWEGPLLGSPTSSLKGWGSRGWWVGFYLPVLGGQGQCHSSSSQGALEPCGDEKRFQLDSSPNTPRLLLPQGPCHTPSPLPLCHPDEPPGNPISFWVQSVDSNGNSLRPTRFLF